MKKPADVLKFWFGEGEDLTQNAPLWFKKSDEFDSEVKSNFLDSLTAAKNGQLDHWKRSPQECLAFVILLDQFSRNIFRNLPQAFELDHEAVGTTLFGIEQGYDKMLNHIERWFFYMPLMHSESLEHQQESINVYKELLNSSPKEHKSRFEDILKFAVRHFEIVDQFGRFPHRNKVLNRESTAEEEKFLTKPGSSF